MAFDELPPDPYQCLGVSKDAKLPEIRSAHRKLVLKCHPDKVQDAALKAIKQDEFQKVQQAYELLSDDNRRLQYDEQVKLYALRKEMAGARGKPTPRSNPFEYEVHNAEPRATTYKYTTSRPAAPQRETTKVYPQQQRPNSYEDVVYEEPIRQAKKSASYESADRERKSSRREEDRARDARREEDERARQKWEKEAKRSAHGEKKRKEDKAKRRAGDEKHSARTAYYEDEVDSDELRASRSREKARQKAEDEFRVRQEEAQAAYSRADAAARAARDAETRQAPLTPKWDDHKEYAAQYMKAARRKAAPVGTADDFRPRPMERAQTFAAPPPDIKYNIRYAAEPRHVAPLIESDDELPRRSSASRTHRKSAETPPSRSTKETTKSSTKEKPREKEREKESRKKSGRSRSREPYIVSPPSPPLAQMPKQKPSLQTHSSAPPVVPTSRKEPSRSKTQDYPREAPPPTLPRASTFQSGDRAPTDRATRGSRLKKTVDYTDESESDSPVYTSNRHSHSPPPQSRRREPPEPTRYIIDNGRSVPVTRAPHRAEMRNIDDEVPYLPRERERSESPHGTARHPRASERPPVTRAAGSSSTRQAPARSHSQAYYPPPEAPEPVPIIMTARPKMPPREASHGHTSTSRVPRGSGGIPTGGYFGEVSYGKQVRPEDVIYNDAYRRGSDPTHHPHAARDFAYATHIPRDGRVYA